MPFDMNQHTAKLLLNEHFFASLSRRVEKTSTKSIPTAGVRVNKRGFFEMYYNPDFFASLTEKERAGVIKHEFYHLIFEQ